jgi:signal transduction histidine kinase/CheY-like chemotaxis protein/HPt (histidine-containing phosphotransfer) domain-containing protein
MKISDADAGRDEAIETKHCLGGPTPESGAAGQLPGFDERERDLQLLYNELLIETAPLMLFVLDNDLRYVVGTKNLMRLLSFSDQKEMIGLSFKQLFGRTTGGRWIEKMTDSFTKAIDNLSSIDFSDRVILPDDSSLHLRTYISPVIDSGGACRGIAVTFEDITDLSDALERAEAADRSKTSFLANISHEIRTPMNAIKGMNDLLLLTKLDDIQRGYIQNITNATHSLLAIINDLLDFSRIEANKLELLEAPTDTGSLLTDIAGLINLKASEKGLTFVTHISPRTPTMVVCDEIRLKQVLLNLLNNAVKFTGSGYVKFSLQCIPSKADKVILAFSVEDTGRGIKESDLPMIFQPFSQTDRNLSQNTEGTGLGLSISRRLVEKMGGTLEVKSQYDEGSSFYFSVETRAASSESIASVLSPLAKRVLVLAKDAYAAQYENMLRDLGVNYDISCDEESFISLLEKNSYTHAVYKYDFGNSIIEKHMDKLTDTCLPIAIKDIRHASRQNTGANIHVLFEPVLVMHMAQALNRGRMALPGGNAKMGESDLIGSFKFSDVQILLVDDNDINLMVESELLRQYEIEPDTAEGAGNAFELIREKQYDIIFMDHMMPEINGIEATKILREMGGWLSSVPIIALTANAITGMKETYLSCGMNDYISKPIEISELNRVLITWLPRGKITVPEQPSPKDNTSQQYGSETIAALAERLDTAGALTGIGGSESAYIKVVKAFSSTMPGKLSNMREQIAENDYDRFRIDIHASKSSLANIGATDLSYEAKTLEMSAASSDHDYIKENFEQFAERLLELLRFLEETLPDERRDRGNEKNTGSVEVLRTMLENTALLIEDLEQDEALLTMDRATGESYGANLDRRLFQIRAAIESFNYDGASELIRVILSTGETMGGP